MSKGIGYGSVMEARLDGTGSYATLGLVVDGWENSSKTNFGETTLLADQFLSFVPSDTDPGTLTFVIALDNSDSTSNTFLVTARNNRSLLNIRLTYNNSNTKDGFDAYVEEIGRTVKKSEMMTRPVTLRLTGNPGMGST